MYNRYDHEDPLVFPFLKDGYGCCSSLRTERERERERRGGGGGMHALMTWRCSLQESGRGRGVSLLYVSTLPVRGGASASLRVKNILIT